jgi:phenylacetate-CoA ligase
MVMQDFKTTVLHCTPTYAITIAEKMMEMGVRKSDVALRLGVHGAEPMTEELRKEVEEKLGSLAIRDFGLTEMGGPGVAIECPDKAGYHVNEDFYFPEIIDPDTLEPLPEGETGELVFTTLQKDGVPVIRYRTRDITSLNRAPCACGRTLIRMGEIKGRTDDMMIIGGVNFFPSQLESVLLDFEEVAPHYLIKLSKKGRLDRVTVDVETVPSYWSNRAADDIELLSDRVQKHIKDIIGFNMDIHFVEPLTIPRSEGKAKRVLDER